LNEKLEIVGMIKADDPPEGVAVNIQRILDKLREWGYQVNLRRIEARKDDSVLTSRKNDVYNLREVDVSDTRIQITVDYIYIGDQGETVIMEATPLLSDEMIFPDPFSRSVPPPITTGSGSWTVEIERQIRDLETYINTKIKVCMYRSKQPGIAEVFHCKVFPVHKVWRVDAGLKERYPSPDIGGFSAMDLSDTEMTFSVGMRYHGAQLSDKLYLKGCALLDDGRIVPGTACNFAPIVHAYPIQMNIQRLEHLSDRKIYTSSIVEVCLATGKENEPPMDFFCKKFPFNKTWR